MWLIRVEEARCERCGSIVPEHESNWFGVLRFPVVMPASRVRLISGDSHKQPCGGRVSLRLSAIDEQAAAPGLGGGEA